MNNCISRTKGSAFYRLLLLKPVILSVNELGIRSEYKRCLSSNGGRVDVAILLVIPLPELGNNTLLVGMPGLGDLVLVDASKINKVGLLLTGLTIQAINLVVKELSKVYQGDKNG